MGYVEPRAHDHRHRRFGSFHRRFALSEITLWNGRTVPRIGMGCWAIGGPLFAGDVPLSYGDVDDNASRAGIAAALELGIRFFDTSPNYDAGHSEDILGGALGGRDDVIIATKVGYSGDPETRQSLPEDASPAAIRRSVDASRRRLRRDRLDLLQFHINGYPADRAGEVFDTVDALHEEGIIDVYGWSTDNPASAAAFADRAGFVSVQHDFNVLTPAKDVLTVTQKKNLLSLNRLPLAMGLLTGKYRPGAETGKNDVRASGVEWLTYFKNGEPAPEFAARLAAIRELLRTGGRSLAQGALGWILARSPNTLPLPGFKNEAQVRDNFGAIQKGPLPASVMTEIDGLLGY
jgi:aryl-alcohol dehydrogenase-like predicted oxidoreductase